MQSDKSIRKYTGFLSKEILYEIFAVIQENLVKINYWKGPGQFKEETGQSRRGRSKQKSDFDEYLITLIYIRKALGMDVLAELFGVSKTYVSYVVTTWINILYDIFHGQLKYPPAETVRKNLPETYPSKYSDTRIILDCTEFFTAKPKNCTAQAATYSSYKNHNTVKLLVGITPTGLITFVSNVYGGCTSDRHIFEKEFLDKVEPGDAIMVDRGFNIADLLLEKKAKLYIPPFTRKKAGSDRKSLTQSEIAKTREIASLRIHVERAIERMKNYKLLSQTIDISLWPLLDQLMVIIAVLCNMEPPLLND